jgi:hypothetical protein
MFFIRTTSSNTITVATIESYTTAQTIAQTEANKRNEPVVIYSAKFECHPKYLECVKVPMENN